MNFFDRINFSVCGFKVNPADHFANKSCSNKDGSHHKEDRSKTCQGTMGEEDRNLVIYFIEEDVGGHKDTCEDAVECGSAEEMQGFCEVAEEEAKGN